MGDRKPLPAIPNSHDLMRLSVEAQEHRARFIRFALSELDDDWLRTNLEEWANLFEDVLDDLGSSVGQGQWFSGIMKAKKQKRKKVGGSTESSIDERLKQLRQVAEEPDVPSSIPKSKHLLLCLAPLGSRIAEPDEDSGFDVVPSALNCSFRSGLFVVPGDRDASEGILYGLAEWDTSPKDVPTRLVGGTFIFKGVSSLQHHRALTKALKLCIYVHLSLLLEQQLLANSHVPLTFSRPRVRVHTHSSSYHGSQSPLNSPPPLLDHKTSTSSTSSRKSGNRNSLIPSSIFSFFSKKSFGRATSIRDVPGRSSLDLIPFPSVSEEQPGRYSMEEAASRFRKFSFLSPPPLATPLERTPSPYSSTLSRIEAQKNVLSSSAGVVFDPPTLLVRLAEKEKANPDKKIFLTGDERVALHSLLGWDALEPENMDPEKTKANKGKGMAGICGFINQQEISILVSSHIPLTGVSPEQFSPEASMSSSISSSLSLPRETSSSSPSFDPSDSSNVNKPPKPTFTHTDCEQPHWLLYRYYSTTQSRQDSFGHDHCLGDMITEWIDQADVPCGRVRSALQPEPRGGIGIVPARLGSPPSEKRCEVPIGKHERRFIHGGVRITVNIENGDPATLADDEKRRSSDAKPITVWESCSICGAETKKNELSDGAHLFSFAKYMELLIYSPLICNLSPTLCEHTKFSSSSASSLPSERFNIVRHFSQAIVLGGSRWKEYTVSFKTDPVEDIFELRVPRLQITRDLKTNLLASASQMSLVKEDKVNLGNKDDEEKRKLRREIKAWWEGVADHMDLLEEKFATQGNISLKKALPRLPSTDEAYDSFEDEPEEHQTPKAKMSGLPETSTTIAKDYFVKPITSSTAPNLPTQPTSSSISSASLTPTPSRLPMDRAPASATSTDSQLTVTTSSSASSIHSTESTSADPMELLSNLRQTFHRTEQSLYTQLAKVPASSLNEVRRSFLSSARGAERRLIAWQKKHLGGKKKKSGRGDKDDSNQLNPSEKLRAAEPQWWSSTCHVVPGGNIIVREDDWGSIIAFTLSTPDYQRELASMSVTRTASTADLRSPDTPIASSTSASSFFSAATATGYKLFRTSALVQPDPDQEDVIWHEPEAYSAVISRKEHPRDATSLLSIREVLRQKSPDSSILSGSRFASLGSSTSKLLAGSGRASMFNGAPPSAWAKPDVQVSKQEAEGEVARGLSGNGDGVHRMLHELDSAESGTMESRPGSSLLGNYPWTASEASTIKRNTVSRPLATDDVLSFTGSDTVLVSPEIPVTPQSEAVSPVAAKSPLGSFTSGITNAMRLVIPAQIPRPLSAGSNHHGLLSGEVNAIDERPHIKYDWTIGKRLKFSCTVYYAKQFDSLRKRCGIDNIFLESLSKSTNWSAEGGKSKSNFWKTADDRFIIKTLVNAWNVADLQVLIELGPSYFRYLDSTASKATVLAKLIGFYTIEIRNLETGAVQSKVDLLIMENLFYNQNVDKTFDLKGIQGRKVKAGNNTTGQTTKTLFDGEWIEGQQQALTLVRPHSKAVLREAIKSDAEFLSKSNIMDYSLLLGVDTKRKQIACGLVDTIGSYTFAKTLEYKAKQGLNSGNGKEVTVIPPAEYQERFLNALEKYFLACPDKWSRPLDGRKLASDLSLLPSVL